LIPSLLCNNRIALDPLENLNVGFDDTLMIRILMEAKRVWFLNQSVIWNDKYCPEMFEFLGSNGYGYAFNMMTEDRMYREG
jgi:hypothetical protein